MSWGTRDRLKRKYAQAEDHVVKAQKRLLRCLRIYEKASEEYPDHDYSTYVEVCDSLMTMLEMTRNELESVQEKI